MSAQGAKKSDEGIMSKMGDTFEAIFGLPDRPKNPAARKAARIFFSIFLMGAGVALFFTMNRGGFSSLADPSLSTLMSSPLSLGIVSVGAAWILQDIVGREGKRVLSRIFAIALPILLAGSSIALISAGFHGGVTYATPNYWCFVGLILVPIAFAAIGKAVDFMKANDSAAFLRRSREIKEVREKRRQRNLESLKQLEKEEAKRLEDEKKMRQKELSENSIELDEL